MPGDTYTVVVIPTLFESDLLKPLLEELYVQRGYDELIVMDNRPEGRPGFYLDAKVVIDDASKMSFYGMWNDAWMFAKTNGAARGVPSNLVLLNDDIKIPELFVSRLTDALRSDDDCWCAYPNYSRALADDDFVFPSYTEWLTPTKGTYKNGGLWGCAFALRGEILNDPLPPIDEQFVIWCGDDDLVKQIDLAGKKTCRVNGLALEHQASTTLNQHPELQPACWEDVERYNQKYAS